MKWNNSKGKKYLIYKFNPVATVERCGRLWCVDVNGRRIIEGNYDCFSLPKAKELAEKEISRLVKENKNYPFD